MTCIEADEVGVRVGEHTLLDGVSLRITPGRLSVIAGPNGAGKSTLLNVLSGDRVPSSGEVRIDGSPLRKLSDLEQAHRRSVMSQSIPVALPFSVLEIVRMGWLDALRPPPALAARIEQQLLHACGIAGLQSRSFSTLSGGEQRRVHLARALLQIWRPENEPEPRFLLLDEPTANLDIGQEIALLERVRAEADRGAGVAAIVHDLNLAARFADDVLLLDRGTPIAHGPPATVLCADRLSRVYQTPVRVERHSELNRLIVIS